MQTSALYHVIVGITGTDEEKCSQLKQFFNTPDNSMVSAGLLLWKTLDSHRQSHSLKPPHHNPISCNKCHVNATCVDVLSGIPDCSCNSPYVGSGEVCGLIHWANKLHSPLMNIDQYDYLLGPPVDDRYSTKWNTRPPTPKKIELSFLLNEVSDNNDNNARVNSEYTTVDNVRMIYIYMPFGQDGIEEISYGINNFKSKDNNDLKIHWKRVNCISDDSTDFYLMTCLLSQSISMNYLQIKTSKVDSMPISIGNVGIMVESLSSQKTVSSSKKANNRIQNPFSSLFKFQFTNS